MQKFKKWIKFRKYFQKKKYYSKTNDYCHKREIETEILFSLDFVYFYCEEVTSLIRHMTKKEDERLIIIFSRLKSVM